MGLTIHYQLSSRVRSAEKARLLVARLREHALKLPLKQVGEIIDLTGKECDFNVAAEDDPNRWLLIQAARSFDRAGRSYCLSPERLIAFSTFPGNGCEEANFGLAIYPKTIEIEDAKWPFRRRQVPTGFAGWSWSSFCKTQYASAPQCGGVENFLRCHLSVVGMLDHAKELGLLREVADEGNYFEKRNVQSLAEDVGHWNNVTAAFAGLLTDELGNVIEAPIKIFSDYEHLEAKGREEG